MIHRNDPRPKKSQRKKRTILQRLGRSILLLSLVAFLFTSCAERPVKATVQDGVQTVRVVVKHGYKPSKIEAKAGMPLRIEFIRKEKPGVASCGEDLSIPSENINIHLPANESQIVEIAPQKPGNVTFECGMKMMKGTITFKE